MGWGLNVQNPIVPDVVDGHEAYSVTLREQ
jgi:hypothetical protein